MHTAYRLLPLLLLIALPLHAHSFLVAGQIVDAATGQPLPDANLTIGASGTRSDASGRFALTIAPGDSLQISFIGYQTRTLHPQEATTLVIRLHRAILATPELVVHGGLKTQRRAETATSVTVLNRQALQSADGHHLQDLIQTLSMAGKTAKISLVGPDGNGSLNLVDGGIVHASWEDQRGEDALVDLFGMTKGRFEVQLDEKPEGTNIQGDTNFLMLEATRRLDEKQRGS